jgi:hypothetical protein
MGAQRRGLCVVPPFFGNIKICRFWAKTAYFGPNCPVLAQKTPKNAHFLPKWKEPFYGKSAPKISLFTHTGLMMAPLDSQLCDRETDDALEALNLS